MPICLASLPILPGSAAGAAALKYWGIPIFGQTRVSGSGPLKTATRAERIFLHTVSVASLASRSCDLSSDGPRALAEESWHCSATSSMNQRLNLPSETQVTLRQEMVVSTKHIASIGQYFQTPFVQATPRKLAVSQHPLAQPAPYHQNQTPPVQQRQPHRAAGTARLHLASAFGDDSL